MRDAFSDAIWRSRKAVCEEVEMHRCRNDARKFYQKVKRLTEGLKPGASSCKDKNLCLIKDPQGVLGLWKKHCSTLLQSYDHTNTASLL